MSRKKAPAAPTRSRAAFVEDVEFRLNTLEDHVTTLTEEVRDLNDALSEVDRAVATREPDIPEALSANGWRAYRCGDPVTYVHPHPRLEHATGFVVPPPFGQNRWGKFGAFVFVMFPTVDSQIHGCYPWRIRRATAGEEAQAHAAAYPAR